MGSLDRDAVFKRHRSKAENKVRFKRSTDVPSNIRHTPRT